MIDGVITNLLFKLGAFLVVIVIIALVHEFGHFIAAKAVGIRVIRFSIFMPPKIFSWKMWGTDFQLGSLPIGGYVKMAGIIDESLGDEESAITGAKDEFISKNPLQKSLVLCAGVLMNMIFAWALAIVLAFAQGKPVVDEPVIGTVASNMPASTDLKLQPDDRIFRVDGILTPTWNQLTSAIHNRVGEKISLEWVRGKDTLRGVTTTLVREMPDSSGTAMYKVGLIGISPKVHYTAIGFGEAIVSGHRFAWYILKGSAVGFSQLFTGRASVKELVGPVGIVQMSGESASAGAPVFWGFLILISISVGMVNILPLPVLDGGHLVMVWIEAIIRKPIPTMVKLRIQQFGIAFLLLMILFISYHDILRIWSGN